MAGLSDVDLIPKVLSVDKKVRLSGIDRRREQQREQNRGSRPRKNTTDETAITEKGKQGTIDITV